MPDESPAAAAPAPAPPASAARSVLWPTVAVLAVTTVALFTYHNFWRVAPTAVHRPVATVAGLVAFAGIGFGSLVIYPLGRRRGASLPVLVLACLATPLAWNVKEMLRVSAFFTPGESLYWGLNTAFLLAAVGAAGEMGLCELLVRLRRRRADPAVRVLTPGPLVAMGVALLALFALLVWGGGVHAFYIYMQGYRALFT